MRIFYISIKDILPDPLVVSMHNSMPTIWITMHIMVEKFNSTNAQEVWDISTFFWISHIWIKQIIFFFSS